MNDKVENTLLIVDDDSYVLESISTLLKEFGYSVVTSPNALDAMKQVEKMPFDVILTDHSCPK